MSEDIVFIADGKSSEQAKIDLLTGDDRCGRIIARGMVSDWSRLMALWLNDEYSRLHGDQRADLLRALAEIQVSVFASLIAQTLKPSGEAPAVELYVRLLREKVPLACTEFRKAMEARS